MGISNWSGRDWRVGVLAVVAGLLITLSATAETREAAKLYLVSAQPNDFLSKGGPFPAKIFSCDDSTGSLQLMWEFEAKHEGVTYIGLYTSESLLVIGPANPTLSRLFIFDLRRPLDSQPINWSDSQRAMFDHVVAAPSEGLVIQLRIAADVATHRTGLEQVGIAKRASTVGALPEIRLAGCDGPYTYATSDVVWIPPDEQGNLRCFDTVMLFPKLHLPRGVAELPASRGYAAIACERDWIALSAIPTRNEQRGLELLVYRRSDSTWRSYVLEGLETRPHLINGFLAGIIAYPNEKTDFSVPVRYDPPVISEDAYIVEPLSGTLLKAHLGQEPEVLWLEKDTIFYRLGDSLYYARFAGDSLCDRRLLVTDPQIKHVHWAFRR